MKVKSISSFFQKSGSASRGTADNDPDSEEEFVEVPPKLKKSKSKKSKSKEENLNVSVGNTDDSDREDPLPKSSRKKDQTSSKNKSKSVKPLDISDDDDSDKEDPLPKSSRNKNGGKDKHSGDKKRKARVLSDSEDDDFKPTQKGSKGKPVVKLAKVEKQPEPKAKEMKRVNPADFFGSGPIKRESKKESVKPTSSIITRTSPRKKVEETVVKQKEDSPKKNGKASVPSPTKSKAHNGDREVSPHRQPTSSIEPKKLKMNTPTPEKSSTSESSTKKRSSPLAKTEKTLKPSSEKVDSQFKVPTPVAKDKAKPRTNSGVQKRQVSSDEEEEEDFNPKKKVAPSPNTSKSKGRSLKGDKTPAKDSVDEDDKPTKRETTPQQKENFKKFLEKQSLQPKNLGSKEIPIGASNCLQELTFVMTGVLDSLERDDCKDLILKYGGRVTGSVSRKTSYLIVGDEPGESKVKKAMQLKVPQIDENGLLDMIKKSNPNGNSQDSGLEYSEGLGSEQFKTEDEDKDESLPLFDSPVSTTSSSRIDENNSSPTKITKPSLVSPKKEKVTETTSVLKQIKDKKGIMPISSAPPASSAMGHDGLMWVDKHKPKTLKNIVGQGAETSNAKKLLRWLQNWFQYHGSSDDKPKAAWPGLKDPEGKTFKAALLSGPPGIGKTTTAHLVIKDVGLDYFELNASDTRNKRGLKENVADALSCKTLAFGHTNGDKARKHVLIMDEVDGMSGNEDRGGVQELIGLIKSSRIPVICICNDRSHPKIRSLANYCFDLRFNKPSFEQLKGFIMSICFKEKIKVPAEKIRQLIISTDNDVRQILHQLELFKDGNSPQAYNPRKDIRFGLFDVIRKVLYKPEHEKMSIHDKNGLFFQDYSMGPLFVQENYIRWQPARASGSRCKHMDLVSKTASSIADGELVESFIKRAQNWSLLPVQAAFSSYIPGEYMASNQIGQVEFPKLLGKTSNKNKRQRLLQSLHSHMQLHVSGSLEALNMDYLPYLRRSITNPLVNGDHQNAAAVMEKYTLLREDIESITDLTLWPGFKDPMDKVDSKVKAAFTRQVNKEILPYSNVKTVKAKGRGGGGTEDDLEALLDEAEGLAVEEEEEDESIEKDGMVKVKTRKPNTSKAGTSSSAKGQKRKKQDDYDEDDFEDKNPKSSKNAKTGKAKPAKPHKGK